MVKEIPITRDEVRKLGVEEYNLILDKESHHDHELVMVEDVLRWKRDKYVSAIIDRIGMNDISELFQLLGYDRNSDIYRKWYRSIGYGLSGYWEIFYCRLNNEDCDEYKGGKL
jgi:hypothetical protein